MDPQAVEALQQRIGYQFRDVRLLEEALTHASTTVQNGSCYERLEFLGDAVLGMVVAEHLFQCCPDQDEGGLTKTKSSVVCGPVLKTAAKQMRLADYAVVDKTVASRGISSSLLADMFEAIIGAIYLDGGLDEARRFILFELGEKILEALRGEIPSDPKSLLQLHAHRVLGCDPVYRIIEEMGPAHRKHFRAAVNVGGEEYASDWAATKAAAERRAAAVALKSLDVAPERDPA